MLPGHRDHLLDRRPARMRGDDLQIGEVANDVVKIDRPAGSLGMNSAECPIWIITGTSSSTHLA